MEQQDEIPVKTMPGGLKTAEQIAEKVAMSAERILQLANTGYMPHYRVEGGEPLFQVTPVQTWIRENATNYCAGRPMAQRIQVVWDGDDVFEEPPKEIKHIPNLRQIPTHGFNSGVYFLCLGAQVVYVGQSVNPGARISNHVTEGKKLFDRVYLLPVPEDELNDVEAAFIDILRPQFNGRIGSWLCRPASVKKPAEVLKRFDIELEKVPENPPKIYSCPAKNRA